MSFDTGSILDVMKLLIWSRLTAGRWSVAWLALHFFERNQIAEG
jgi:hypothetical protein